MPFSAARPIIGDATTAVFRGASIGKRNNQTIDFFKENVQNLLFIYICTVLGLIRNWEDDFLQPQNVELEQHRLHSSSYSFVPTRFYGVYSL